MPSGPGFEEAVRWGFYALTLGCVGYGVKLLSDLRISIDRLNLSVERIVEKTTWHEKQLDRLDERILRLEECRE
jgi:hypothetical protein